MVDETLLTFKRETGFDPLAIPGKQPRPPVNQPPMDEPKTHASNLSKPKLDWKDMNNEQIMAPLVRLAQRRLAPQAKK
eukprot:12889232-Prorocentrum_lima.AAC.1